MYDGEALVAASLHHHAPPFPTASPWRGSTRHLAGPPPAQPQHHLPLPLLQVDHANSRVMFGILDDVMKSKDDKMLEKVVHAIGIHCRMHNQARRPRVQQISSHTPALV